MSGVFGFSILRNAEFEVWNRMSGGAHVAGGTDRLVNGQWSIVNERPEQGPSWADEPRGVNPRVHDCIPAADHQHVHVGPRDVQFLPVRRELVAGNRLIVGIVANSTPQFSIR